LICCGDPKQEKMPPYTMIPILLDKASASSIECVVRIIHVSFLFPDVIPERTCHIKRFEAGSIPAEGSSSRII
jgi:hypothetical protein